MSQSWADTNDTKPYLFFEGDEGDAMLKAQQEGIHMTYDGHDRAVYVQTFDTYDEALRFAFSETVESGAIGRTMERLNVDPSMMKVYTEAEL